ncbi:MAG: DUF2268 domain-containing putative Zn-dependent protease [Patescibacteria group bacterium]|nr:DUF2268 domain-containing putative Zn-dependent protease [Patescibacteria group bacterium]
MPTLMPDPKIYDQLESYVHDRCSEWFQEARKRLPQLPDTITINIDTSWIVPGTASGGFTPSSSAITVAYDPFFKTSLEAKEKSLKASVFHESFHVAQGFTGEQRTAAPLTEAVQEGAATVFEMLRVGTRPDWGNYPVSINEWFQEVMQLPLDYDRTKWKFYDPVGDRKWVLYRVGTYIVSTALQKNAHLSIESLATKQPEEILQLSGL